MKDTDHHDCFLIRLIENQVIAESWHNEPADLRVARNCLADASPKFTMLGQKIGGVEYCLPDTLGGFGIIGSDVTLVLVQIANGPWTESRSDHSRRRNSSVVLN